MDDTYIREQREISKIEAENSLGNAWQEHVAGNPGLSDLTDKEYAAEADRFFRQARTELGLEPIEDNKSAGAAALKRHSHGPEAAQSRSEEHTSELQSLMRISYAVFCLKKKNTNLTQTLLPQHRKQKKKYTHRQ